MSVLVDPRESGGLPIAPGVPSAELASLTPAFPIGFDLDSERGSKLPADHPPWAKDVLSLSARFRGFMAQVKPAAIRVLTFWDHRIRSIMVCGRRLSVDASGCYRAE
jgi:hypothetical protein